MNKIEYPNPQKIRKKWVDLNGEWRIYFPKKGSANTGVPDVKCFTETLEVPYSYTFKKSIEDKEYHPIMWYFREFSINVQQNKQYLLNFEAVDYSCEIWFNDQLVFLHTGGHTPFEIDITSFIKKMNKVFVKVTDYNLVTQPIGKQKWKEENFLCWYTRTIGIWQNVWIEEVGMNYLKKVITIPNVSSSSIEIDAYISQPTDAVLEVEVSYKNEIIGKLATTFKNGRAKFSMDVSTNSANFRLHYWSPETPNLYDIEYRIIVDGKIEDQIFSYFGMRNIRSFQNKIYLNEQSLYQKLILNQGYYSESGLTGTAKECEEDIIKIKEMGFNGHRIHQKVESHRMLYLCDKLGLITWAEFPSTFEFSLLSIKNTMNEIPAFIQKHINHPSVLVYVLMNESWGVNEIAGNYREQNFVDALYHQVKAYDDSRLVIGNDGWEQTKTDICTIHDYNSNEKTLLDSYKEKHSVFNGCPSLTSGRKVFCKNYVSENIPLIISEYGGIAYSETKDEFSWGYGNRIDSKEEVIEKIKNLTEAVMKIEFCCGFCYTQFTDVEQEVNGLLTKDHQYKFDPKIIRNILESDRQSGFVFK